MNYVFWTRFVFSNENDAQNTYTNRVLYSRETSFKVKENQCDKFCHTFNLFVFEKLDLMFVLNFLMKQVFCSEKCIPRRYKL